MNLPAQLKLLVIDDDDIARMNVERMLGKSDAEGRDYRFVMTRSKAEGLAALQAEQFDCLLLDFRLPDGDGLELLAEAAATHLRLPPTVLMTTLNDRQTALKALSLGAQDYLVKGEFTQAMLVRAIQYGIQRDQLVQERDRLLRELQAAIENIKTLKGLLPVCSSCKKIRDDSGYWDAVDSYIVKHGLATVSHSLCPTCIRQMYPGMADKIIAATAAEERRTNPSTPG